MPNTPRHTRVRNEQGAEWDCPTRYLPHAERQGWVRTDGLTDDGHDDVVDPDGADDGDPFLGD